MTGETPEVQKKQKKQKKQTTQNKQKKQKIKKKKNRRNRRYPQDVPKMSARCIAIGRNGQNLTKWPADLHTCIIAHYHYKSSCRS